MRKMMLLNLLFLAGSLMGCNEDVLLEDFTFNDAEISYQQGDTTAIRRSLDPKYFGKFDDRLLFKNTIVMHDTVVKFEGIILHGQPVQNIDLSKLKKTDSKNSQLEYVAIGGSLTAGVRDGGYYNEGILTAYPELIARQMKLENFKSPTFESSDYNGVGRKVFTAFNPTQGAIKKYAVVTNNTGIVGYDEKTKQPILKKSRYERGELNNLALPGQRLGGVTDAEYLKNEEIYRNRFFTEKNKNGGINFYEVVKERQVDFFTYESCSSGFAFSGSYEVQGFMMQSTNPNKGFMGSSPYEDYLDAVMSNAKEMNLKGIFLALPNHNYFPAYWQIPCGAIEKNSNNVLQLNDCRDGYVYGNTSIMDSLASPVVNLNFKTHGRYPDADGTINFVSFYREDEQYFDFYNSKLREYSKKYGFPVVELDKIYTEILSGRYVTDDGVKVTASMNGDNFFSTDGLYPTAFGHAVIANEILKVINNYYKTRIPLINTREYLK